MPFATCTVCSAACPCHESPLGDLICVDSQACLVRLLAANAVVTAKSPAPARSRTFEPAPSSERHWYFASYEATNGRKHPFEGMTDYPV